MSWPARASISAPPSSLAKSSLTRWGSRAAPRPRPAPGATGADVLEGLAAKGIPLARTIVDWRQLTKLKGTYTDALPNYINARTGRVHTSYSQASVLTGRLSSNDPNLQNIPVRTEDGRKIRSAFVAPEGKVLVSADYSQIEIARPGPYRRYPGAQGRLRGGAGHSRHDGERNVQCAGRGHAQVTCAAAPRRINFGIIYGISAFGLANQLGIERGVAGDYIKTYFERFPGIKDYMDAQKVKVKTDGHVMTIFGRKIQFPNANQAIRANVASSNAQASTPPSRAQPPTSSAAP